MEASDFFKVQAPPIVPAQRVGSAACRYINEQCAHYRIESVESLFCCLNVYFMAVLCSLFLDSGELRLMLLCLHSWEDLSHHQVHV